MNYELCFRIPIFTIKYIFEIQNSQFKIYLTPSMAAISA
jgi:hypothetical protein